MSMPRFAEPIPNVTVSIGRDALLACVVDNLRGFKVRKPKHYVFVNTQLMYNNILRGGLVAVSANMFFSSK